MTYHEIASMIKSAGIPHTYYQFKHPQNPPFICFYYPQTSNFQADGVTYQKKELLRIELYTDKKDFKLEKKLEGVLETNGIPWQVDEAYIASEKMFMRTYESEVVING